MTPKKLISIYPNLSFLHVSGRNPLLTSSRFRLKDCRNDKKLCIFGQILIILSFFIFLSNQAFPQDYDFDIPEEEEAKIEFNGNMDAKWGILQTQKNSALYQLQFFDKEKDDFLSQYRLDFYLDGIYRHKQVGLFMKSFYQYAKEEPLSPSFFELYGSLNLSPRWSSSIGKRRFNWGKGYAFNPVGYVNAEKDPENPDLALAGKSSVSINYNKSFSTGALQNLSLTGIILPPEAVFYGKFAPVKQIGAAFKLYLLIKNIDVDFLVFQQHDQPEKYGFDFSTNLKENIEIHGEISYARDEKKFMIVNNQILDQKLNGASYLVGFRYLNRFNTTFIVEYYHNNSGLSDDEFISYQDYLQNSLFNTDQISAVRSDVTTLFRSKTLLRDYLYFKIIQSEPFSWLYSSISLFSIYNLVDNSFILSPQFGYKPFTNSEILVWPFIFLGNNKTEFGSRQFQKKIEVWFRFYF